MYVQRTNLCGLHKRPIHDACTVDQLWGTLHVATCAYVEPQVRAPRHARKTQFYRVVVKKNTSTCRGYVQQGYVQQYRGNTQRVQKAAR